MTEVYLSDGDKVEYDSVTVKVSGWALCFNRDDDTEVDAYPPHRIDRISDSDWGEKRRGEKVTAQTPYSPPA